MSQTNISITVIMPTFNGETRGYLGLALESVYSQTLKPAQVIVVDDGSTDDTVAYLKERFPLVEVFSQKNSGPSAARNQALRKVTSTHIAFIDDDDEWKPEKLRRQMDFLNANPIVDLTFCGMDLIDKSSEQIGQKFPAHFGHKFPFSALGNSFLPPSAILMKKVLADKVGFFDETMRLGEDYEYSIRCSLYGDVKPQNEQLLRYRVHAASSCPDYRPMELANLAVIESVAKRFAPQLLQRMRAYYCYGAIARALFRRDFAFGKEMRQIYGKRINPVFFALRALGIITSKILFLQPIWRKIEYRLVLGGRFAYDANQP